MTSLSPARRALMLLHPTEFAMSRAALFALVALIGGAAGISNPSWALRSGAQLVPSCEDATPCVAHRNAMRVSLLHAGSDAAEVELCWGDSRPKLS